MLRGKYLAVGVLVLTSFSCSFAIADTLDVPGQYNSIGAALADANPGDTIKVAQGRYFEHSLVLPSGVTLAGLGSGPEATIIDGQGFGRILTAENLDSVSFVQNLTFQNGWAKKPEGYDHCGGALYINNSQLRVFNCRFIGNRANADGGAISCMRASPLIINCRFEDNRAGEGGGALDCSYDASPIIQNSHFLDNTAAYGGAVACRGNSTPYFNVCHFDGNLTEGALSHGGAVLSFFWGEPNFTQCTFSRNSADVGGALYSDAESPTNLTSCTIAENTGLVEGAGIFTQDASPEIKTSIIVFQDGNGVLSLGRTIPEITCSNIFGNHGGDWVGAISTQSELDGNLSVDPFFCPTNLDVNYMFNLQDGSPCTIDAGACSDMGAWPVGCNTPLEMLISLVTFSVVWEDGVPVIIWEVEGSRTTPQFRLVRASLENPEVEEDLEFTFGPNGEFLAQDSGFRPNPGENYYYLLYLQIDGGGETLLGTVFLTQPPKAVALQNVSAWPNPFNPQTSVHFELNTSQEVRVDVYGIDGRLVRNLANEMFGGGHQNLVWDGRDNNGRAMASGIFVVMVTSEVSSERLKVTLLK